MIVSQSKIIGLHFNLHNIVKAYYNGNVVFTITNNSDINSESVFAAGSWEDDNLWNNEDLFSNLNII